jgi:beta-glucanase (GH16 family)
MKNILIILPSIIFLYGSFPPRQTPIKQVSGKEYRLVWKDEFNGLQLDRTKWNYRGTGKRGDAFNSRTAITLDGQGHLVIKVFKSVDSIITGMIDTERLFETRYGYFECRAALTSINGIWTAFWLQSSANRDHGTPELNGAEIDIFEYFHHVKRDSVAHTLHWGGYGPTHKMAGPVWVPVKKTSDGFHTFGLEWTENSYTTFVDGVKTYTGNVYISKVPEFMILSIEVNKAIAGVLNPIDLPDLFIVDYVRVYERQ